MRPVRAFRFLIPSKLEGKWVAVDWKAGGLADARHIYRLVMMSIDLSKKFTSHVQMVIGSADVIVPHLLRYHMLLLYCTQPFN